MIARPATQPAKGAAAQRLGRTNPTVNLNMVVKSLSVVRATSGKHILGTQAPNVHRLVSRPTNLTVKCGAVEHLGERLRHPEDTSSSQHRKSRASWNDGDAAWVAQRLQNRLDECHWPLGHRNGQAKKTLTPRRASNHGRD